MSFQDPPYRKRQPRFQTLAQYQDGGYPSYQDHAVVNGSGTGGGDGYQGLSRLGGTPRQRPPWESAAQQSGSTGPQSGTRTTGAHRSVRNTGSHRAQRDTGGQPSAWDTGGQPAFWDTPARESEWDPTRRLSGLLRPAPDADPGGGGTGSPRRSRGLLAGAIAGFLAAAVALGVANLVAAFVRPQASPIIAVGEAFIDRTPSALKEFAIQKFGENDKNMLLLGMYVTIAFIAIAIGVLAWRRLSIGVAGIGLFGLFGAFVAITRPDSHVTDVIPSIVGGIAGVAAIVWLVRAGMPGSRAIWSRER